LANPLKNTAFPVFFQTDYQCSFGALKI